MWDAKLSSTCPIHSQVSVVVSPLSLPSYRELKHAKRGMCRRVRKLYVNSYTSVVNPLRTDIRTYKHNLGLRRHKRPLRPDNTFGNYLSWLCTSEKDPFACSSLDVNTEVYVSACSIVFHSNPKNMQQPQQSESLTVN